MLSYFNQGGFRWQTITLSAGQPSIIISDAGIQSTVSRIAVNKLPGDFSASNQLFENIYDLGARAVQEACIPAHSAPSTWKITSQGAYIRGQQPALASGSSSIEDLYTLKFSTKIARGGTGWQAGGSGYFSLTSEYPPGTFVNTNRSLVPPNSISFSYGWNLVNQSTLPTGPVVHYKVPVVVKENTWYEIGTRLTSDSYVISIDGKQVAEVSMSEYNRNYPSAPASLTGSSFGFGPFQDQTAYFKDVTVIAANSTTIYSNKMTTDDVLYEYGVHENTDNVCLDGAKRDRLVWIGDFAHTARTLGTTTNRLEFISGVADFCFARQAPEGFVPIDGAMGSRPIPGSGASALQDYQAFFLNSVYDYYRSSGDLAFIRKYWPNIQKVMTYLLTFQDPTSKLLAGNSFFFIGPANGTAMTSLVTYALRHLVEMATDLGDSKSAANYSASADVLSQAVQSELWSESLGTFSVSTSDPGNFSVTGIAFAILAGIATDEQARSSIEKALPKLENKIGYNDISSTDASTHLSPNTNGFLLEAIMATASKSLDNAKLATQLAQPAKLLLDGMWRNMVVQDKYYTGTSWEYMYNDGRPGIELFTSHSHPWGSAPSYVLPEYVLGLKNSKAGWTEWTLTPFPYGLGLNWVSGKVKTPKGELSASWRISGQHLEVSVKAPKGTKGSIILPRKTYKVVGGKDARYTVLM